MNSKITWLLAIVSVGTFLALGLTWIKRQNSFSSWLKRNGGVASVSIADLSRGGSPKYMASSLSQSTWRDLFEKALSDAAEPDQKRLIDMAIKIVSGNGEVAVIFHYGDQVWRFDESWLNDDGQLLALAADEGAGHRQDAVPEN